MVCDCDICSMEYKDFTYVEHECYHMFNRYNADELLNDIERFLKHNNIKFSSFKDRTKLQLIDSIRYYNIKKHYFI
jgi:hypothetical protein